MRASAHARARAHVRARGGAAQALADLGFPVRNLEFSGDLVVRGCIVDKVRCAARAQNPRAFESRDAGVEGAQAK
jgi:hypothetical protein